MSTGHTIFGRQYLPQSWKIRTKEAFPYNYDAFMVWGEMGAKHEHSAYTDRLWQWDPDKHDRLCLKHFGNRSQRWDDRDPKLIEVFLRDYYDSPALKLVQVVEYCNQATGYPVWYLAWTAPAESR